MISNTLNRTKMKRPKLTPWYPPEIKPVRKGCYHRKWGNNLMLTSVWNGQSWRTIAGARSGWGQNLPWRGLAEKP